MVKYIAGYVFAGEHGSVDEIEEFDTLEAAQDWLKDRAFGRHCEIWYGEQLLWNAVVE